MKESYLILKYSVDRRIHYYCLLADGKALRRGISDTSEGRRVLTALRAKTHLWEHCSGLPGIRNIYTTLMTYDEAASVNESGARPPHPEWP